MPSRLANPPPKIPPELASQGKPFRPKKKWGCLSVFTVWIVVSLVLAKLIPAYSIETLIGFCGLVGGILAFTFSPRGVLSLTKEAQAGQSRSGSIGCMPFVAFAIFGFVPFFIFCLAAVTGNILLQLLRQSVEDGGFSMIEKDLATSIWTAFFSVCGGYLAGFAIRKVVASVRGKDVSLGHDEDN